MKILTVSSNLRKAKIVLEDLMKVPETGLSTVAGLALYVISEYGYNNPSVIARAVGRPTTSFTVFLDELEKTLLIARKWSTTDRRVVDILLTEAGGEAAKKVKAHLVALEERIGHLITPEFLATLEAIATIE